MREFFPPVKNVVDDKQYLSEVEFSPLLGFSLYTTSTHHRVKQSPKSTTEMFSVAYVMLCSARNRSCGQQAIGASITTNNAPAHFSHLIQTFLAKDQTPVVCRASYSPDVAPLMWLFSKLKRKIRQEL